MLAIGRFRCRHTCFFISLTFTMYFTPFPHQPWRKKGGRGGEGTAIYRNFPNPRPTSQLITLDLVPLRNPSFDHQFPSLSSSLSLLCLTPSEGPPILQGGQATMAGLGGSRPVIMTPSTNPLFPNHLAFGNRIWRLFIEREDFDGFYMMSSLRVLLCK